MSPTELDRIAHKLIAERIASGDVVQMHWVVQELINGQGEINGDGVDFFALCAREHVYGVVKKAVDKYDKPRDGDGDPQLNLDGYGYLRVAYTVEREKERQLVPIHLLTYEELTERSEQFVTQGKAMIAHGKELVDYRDAMGLEAAM